VEVTMLSERGVTLMCETAACSEPASTAWYGAWHGRPVLACTAHNPMANVAVPLPLNFTSQPLCHACGQPAPVRVS
jgi:hypothetical protein